ncbi:MAG: prepilin-type N-terminal cleavage/methylation domain-containing protein [Patescibacteria group bacterium]
MKKTSGFTLMEIIIVVGIILILAVMGMGSYSIARRAIVMDLETDKLVALLNSTRDESKKTAKCFGIRFAKNSAPRKIHSIYANYVNGCSNEFALVDVEWSKEIVVGEDLTVIFIPPQGAMKLDPEAKTAQIVLNYNGTNSVRTISFNTETGKIEKLTK